MTQSVGNSVRNLVRTWAALFCVLVGIVMIAIVLAYGHLSDGAAKTALVLCAATVVTGAASIIREKAWLVGVAAVLMLAGVTSAAVSLEPQKPGVDSLQQVHRGPAADQFELVHVDQA